MAVLRSWRPEVREELIREVRNGQRAEAGEASGGDGWRRCFLDGHRSK